MSEIIKGIRTQNGIAKFDYESLANNPFCGIPYCKMEMGNISINASGWNYLNSPYRVRTAKNQTLKLKVGDVIGLTDYTDARYYLGW